MNNPHFAVRSVFLTMAFAIAYHSSGMALEPQSTSTRNMRKDAIVIALRPNVKMESRVIRLRDVAAVSGGDAALREKLNGLDIEDALPLDESISILPTQIEFRLRIAGVDVKKIVIRGAASHVTTTNETSSSGPEITNVAISSLMAANRLPEEPEVGIASINDNDLEHEIVQAVNAFILGKLPWPAESIDVRLAQPLSLGLRQIPSADGYEFTPEMKSSGPSVGRVSVRVIGSAPQKPTIDVTLSLDVRHFDNVALTTKQLDRGHVISASDIYFDRRDVTELTDYCSNAKELVGTTTKRAVRALMPLRMVDVESTSRSENGIAIKRREQVKMVARVGVLVVSAMGEAQQDGKIGEVIRLKNLETNANVQGRITGPGEVEVSF